MRVIWLASFMLPLPAMGMQEMSVPPVTTASPGGYANPLQLDTGRYKRSRPSATTTGRSCSPDALPAADRRRMEAEYARLLRTKGKAVAREYSAEQGKKFRAELVAQGICPDAAGKYNRAASADRPKGKKVLRDKQGRVCTKTRIEMRPVANFDGGMTMGMTPVCAN